MYIWIGLIYFWNNNISNLIKAVGMYYVVWGWDWRGPKNWKELYDAPLISC